MLKLTQTRRTVDNVGFPADAQIRRFFCNPKPLISKDHKQPNFDSRVIAR